MLFRKGSGKNQQRLLVRFTGNVGKSLAVSDLVLTGPTGVVPASDMKVHYNPAARTASWSFSGLPEGLPRGTYHLTILSSHIHDKLEVHSMNVHNAKVPPATIGRAHFTARARGMRMKAEGGRMKTSKRHENRSSVLHFPQPNANRPGITWP